MNKRRILGVVLLLLLVMFNSGCHFEGKKLFQSSPDTEKQLIKVQITFTDDQKLETYIKDLGIDEKGKVYIGGSSLNYFYDASGRVLGSYNYQRVLYIEIIPEKNKEK